MPLQGLTRLYCISGREESRIKLGRTFRLCIQDDAGTELRGYLLLNCQHVRIRFLLYHAGIEFLKLVKALRLFYGGATPAELLNQESFPRVFHNVLFGGAPGFVYKYFIQRPAANKLTFLDVRQLMTEMYCGQDQAPRFPYFKNIPLFGFSETGKASCGSLNLRRIYSQEFKVIAKQFAPKLVE